MNSMEEAEIVGNRQGTHQTCPMLIGSHQMAHQVVFGIIIHLAAHVVADILNIAPLCCFSMFILLPSVEGESRNVAPQRLLMAAHWLSVFVDAEYPSSFSSCNPCFYQSIVFKPYG